MANGTITLIPFVAYYGETNLSITGPKVDSPMAVPNRLGSSDADIGPGLAKLFPGAKTYYNKIGGSGGGSHGFSVISGVAVQES